jgi:uncharacterized RDD family membrane protein YckC
MAGTVDAARYWESPNEQAAKADRWGKPLAEQPAGADPAGTRPIQFESAPLTPDVDPLEAPPPGTGPVDAAPAHASQPALAGYVRRMTADLLDIGIIIALVIVAAFALMAVVPDVDLRLGQAVMIVLAVLYVFIGQLGDGQTLGMYLTGCKAVGRDSAPVTPVQALGRTVLWIPDLALRGSSMKAGMAAVGNPRTTADRATRTWTIATNGPLSSLLPSW